MSVISFHEEGDHGAGGLLNVSSKNLGKEVKSTMTNFAGDAVPLTSYDGN